MLSFEDIKKKVEDCIDCGGTIVKLPNQFIGKSTIVEAINIDKITIIKKLDTDLGVANAEYYMELNQIRVFEADSELWDWFLALSQNYESGVIREFEGYILDID